MRNDTRRLLVAGALGAGATLATAYGLLVRPWHLRWGATPEEADRPMPGDEVVPRPNYVSTRAITIETPPEHVWLWLAQMGEEPRGGFYSYDWIERSMGLRVSSARAILPDMQELHPGDILDRSGNVVVRALDPPRWLLLRPPLGLSDGDATWSILLEDRDQRTRLVSRVRARFGPGLRNIVLYALGDPGHFLMERKWLLGLKARAEQR